MLLIVVCRCMMFAACCSLFVVSCLLPGVLGVRRLLPFVACCLLLVGCYLLCVA